MAWQLLTEVYKLPKDRLYITYFGGDPKLPRLQPDLEAKQMWLDVGVPEDHIIPCGAKDNFWGKMDVVSRIYIHIFICIKSGNIKEGRGWSVDRLIPSGMLYLH